MKGLGAPAPEEASKPVDEAGDKAPTEEGTAAPTLDAQDAMEESVEASDAMADAVPVADEEGANVAVDEESTESIKKVRAWLSKIAKHARRKSRVERYQNDDQLNRRSIKSVHF